MYGTTFSIVLEKEGGREGEGERGGERERQGEMERERELFLLKQIHTFQWFMFRSRSLFQSSLTGSIRTGLNQAPREPWEIKESAHDSEKVALQYIYYIYI